MPALSLEKLRSGILAHSCCFVHVGTVLQADQRCALSWSQRGGLSGAAGWQPGARRVHRTRLRSAPADELFRLASDDARGTLDCARLSPNALAYVGDAVLELFWRGRSIWPPAKLADQQRRVVAAVRAEAQAAAVARLRRGPVGGFALSEADDAWLRRGRNAVGRRGPRTARGERARRRVGPRRASPARSTPPASTLPRAPRGARGHRRRRRRRRSVAHVISVPGHS